MSGTKSLDPLQQPTGGALKSTTGLWANPGDPMFSTISMVATEYYTGTEWKKILYDHTEPEGSEP